MSGKGKIQSGIGFNDVRVDNLPLGSFNEGLRTGTFEANAAGTSVFTYGQHYAPNNPAMPGDDRPRVDAIVTVSIGWQYSITPLDGRGTPQHSVTFPGVTITTSNIQLVVPQ